MAFRAITTRASVATGAETVTKPTGTAEGDILVLAVASETATGTVTTDATYTFTEATGSPITVTGDGGRLRLYFRVAGASEPASYAINCSASVSSIVLAAYSGRNASTTPHKISNNGVSTMTASPSTVTALGVTPTVNDCDILFIGGVDNSSSGTSSWSKPSSMTDRGIASASNWTSVALADLTQTTATATGDITATFTHSGNAGKLAFLVALAPVGGGGGFKSSWAVYANPSVL